jgi:hypothetical protein
LNHDAALRIFDEHLRPDPSQITLQRLDAAALLWRLHLLGVDSGPRFATLVQSWDLSEHAAGPYPFNDLHALLALIGSGDIERAQAWTRQVATHAQRSGGSNRTVARDVGAPLMRGMLAFANSRFDEAIEALYPVRALASRFGGSHAQRDLLDQTLLAAATRAADKSVGRALLNERLMGKPVTPLTEYWAGRMGMRRAAAMRPQR